MVLVVGVVTEEPATNCFTLEQCASLLGITKLQHHTYAVEKKKYAFHCAQLKKRRGRITTTMTVSCQCHLSILWRNKIKNAPYLKRVKKKYSATTRSLLEVHTLVFLYNNDILYCCKINNTYVDFMRNSGTNGVHSTMPSD